MKKRIIFLCIIGTLGIVILVVCIIKFFSIDNTAQRAEERNFIIKGEKYIGIPIGFTEEGKIIARADGFDIMEIPEDKNHNFLVVRSFLDDWTIVRESYVIPTEGEVGVAYLWRERVTEGIKWDMVQSILNNDFQGDFTIMAEAKSEYGATDVMNIVKSIRIGYEDCPVGTDWIGCFGNINGKLVFIKVDDYVDGDLKYTCYILKDEYQDLYNDSVNQNFLIVEK